MHQNSFLHFMDKVYQHRIYDDYFHLTKYHQNDLNAIQRFALEEYQLDGCDLSVCDYTNRHFRTDSQDATNIDNIDTEKMKYLNIYIETMDSLHFYICHLFDSALRIHYTSEDDSNAPNDRKDGPYHETHLARLREKIRNSKSKTRRFRRLNANKFDISSTTDIDDIKHIDAKDTFLDYIYQHLESDDSLSPVQILKFKEVIRNEGYCTESIDIDLDLFMCDAKCNLFLEIQNESMMSEIIAIYNAFKGTSDLQYVSSSVLESLFVKLIM